MYGLGGGGRGVQGGCGQRIEVFVKIQIQKHFFFGGGVGGSGRGGSGWGGGVSVDVNEELKFFGEFTLKNRGRRGGGVGRGMGSD